VRDFIFITILLGLAGLVVFHVSTAAWVALSIDASLMFFAWRTWNPRRIRRR